MTHRILSDDLVSLVLRPTSLFQSQVTQFDRTDRSPVHSNELAGVLVGRREHMTSTLQYAIVHRCATVSQIAGSAGRADAAGLPGRRRWS